MKILVSLSGGMDSAVLLAYLLNEYPLATIEAASFTYGSKHNEMENKAAGSIARHYQVPHRTLHLDFIEKYFKSDLLKSGGEIPEGHYEDPIMKKTVVPFRNGIMLSILAGLAESMEFTHISIANHAGDHAIYPDCRPAFISAMDNAIGLGTYKGIALYAPFSNATKAHIAAKGAELRVPFDQTYSCYKGLPVHCGLCSTCFERKEAFERASLKDPTIYLTDGL